MEKTKEKLLPRGIRNNNPANIERNAIKWQGMSSDQSQDDRFIVFAAPEWGIRALAKILLTYRKKYGLNTVRKIINRYAPQCENNTEAYVLSVAEHLDVEADEEIDIKNYDVMRSLIESIIAHENGALYRDYYPDRVIDHALAKIGVV